MAFCVATVPTGTFETTARPKVSQSARLPIPQSRKNVLNVGLVLPCRDYQGRAERVWPSSFSVLWPEWSMSNSGSRASRVAPPDSCAGQVEGRSPGSRRSVGGRPRLGKGPALFGIRPASSRARRSSISMWALMLRNSSAAHRAKASWTMGSILSSTCLRSLTGHE